MKTIRFISVLIFTLLLFLSCSVLDKLKTEQQPVAESITSVATQNLINELRLSVWMKSHFEQKGKRPIVMVGNLQFKGKTDLELIKIHERELAKHGQFRVIRAYFHRSVLDEWLKNNPDQTDQFPLRWAQNQGADFILMGGLNQNPNTDKTDSVLKLMLISVEKQETVWSGSSEF